MQLMADLNRRGIRLKARGDRLRYSPKSAVPPDMMERLKAHKGELLAALGDNDIPRFVIPLMAPDGLGPDGWPIDAIPWPFPGEPVADSLTVRMKAEIAPGACDRCGAVEYCDVPIHGGESARRDCARCGRTHGFSVWFGQSRNVNR
jgi:hypothetical protein